MLLAELRRQEPELIPVLRRRAAGWCARNDLPEDALEYSIAADDVDAAAGLVGDVAVPASGKAGSPRSSGGRVAGSAGRDRGTSGARRMASLWPRWRRGADAERWANAVNRCQYGDTSRPADPFAEAWAAVLRAVLCRRGAEQMRADADEAARKCAALNIVPPVATVLQGVARVISGDPDGEDAAFEHVMSISEEDGSARGFAVALCERSAAGYQKSGDWSRAELLADQARAVLHRARREESFVTPLVCAAQARTALHRGDIPAARQELVGAQRMRHELTYALPHWAVQARIGLARVHLALTDLAGARTLTREIDELLRHRPGLGTLVGEAEALRAQLSKLRGPDAPGASALTAAELRLLPILATHLSFPQIAEQMSLSRHTVKAEATSTTASSGTRRGIRPSCGRGISASSTGDGPAVGGLFRAPSDIPWRYEDMPNEAATSP